MSIGPFAFSPGVIALLAALAIGLAAAHWQRRERSLDLLNIASTSVLVGLLLARVVFVLSWVDHYRTPVWSALDVRDGGFDARAGWTGALMTFAWIGYRTRTARRPIAAGLSAAVAAWAIVSFLLTPQSSVTLEALDDVPLIDGDQVSVKVSQLAAGKPAVVNLWATWCPPCRHEMPVLQAAQAHRTDVSFIFVNQGESVSTVARFLDVARLATLQNVVFDRSSASLASLDSAGLPGTFFFDANGRLVDRHLGALSDATLAAKLDLLVPSAPAHVAAPSPLGALSARLRHLAARSFEGGLSFTASHR